MTNVLVIAAHPDDELLGAGGTIALHADQGDTVHALIACEGESHRYGQEGVGQREHIEKAAKVLGVAETTVLDFRDQTLETIRLTDLISPIEKVVKELQPDIVYCQHGGDVNMDHKVLFDALLVATRPTQQTIQRIYAFDTASSTEWGYPRDFVPDTWVDISSTLERKVEAMSSYESEVRDYPHPRSLDALRNRARSWGNQCCMDAAEVFMTVRGVLRGGQTPA